MAWPDNLRDNSGVARSSNPSVWNFVAAQKSPQPLGDPFSLLDPETDLVWGSQAPEKPPPSYFDYYYTGADVAVFIDGAQGFGGCEVPILEFGFNIQQQKQPVYGFWDYCVDRDTEALTKRGWVSGYELTEEDMILSMDPSDKQLKWSTIKSIYRNIYDGPMHRLTSNSIDALVTPGHKFCLDTGELVPVEALRNRHRIQTMGEALQTGDQEIYTDAFVELVGWFVTEGHIRSDVNAIELSQSENTNPIYCDEIRLCLKRMDVKWTERKKETSGVVQFYIGVKNSVVDKLKSVAPGRVISYDFLSSLSRVQCQLLLDTLIKGDGWNTATGYGVGYSQKNKEAIDSFVFLCALLGIPTSVNLRKEQWCVVLKSGKISKVEHLDFHGGKVDGRYNTLSSPKNPKAHNPTQDYKGIVWCPETEYGTFVCRRNGKVYVTGNTFRSVMRGTRIVTGQFTIATTYPNRMADLIAESASTRVAQRSDTVIRGLDLDEENIEQYWGRIRDPFNTNKSGRHVFSAHPPFNFVVAYGIQSASVSPDPIAKTESLYIKYQNDVAWYQSTNERLVDSNPELPQGKRIIEMVELQGCQVLLTPEGDVCAEAYTFFARDLVDP